MALPEIRTCRLLLRPWTADVVDALHALWAAPEVRRHLWDDVLISRETAEDVVGTHFTLEHLGIGYWTVTLCAKAPDAQELAGFCGFRPIDEGPEIELLYGLKGEYWGKGMITEACSAVLDHLWSNTGYQRVYGRTDPPNEKSVQVMQRLGMRHESTTAFTITYVLHRPG